jgi:hypothetical protein
MTVRATDGYAAAAPLLRQVVQTFGSEDLTLDEAMRGAWVAGVAAVELWDDELWDVLSRRHLDVVRKAGALGLLPLGLANRALFEIHSGNLTAAASLVADAATGAFERLSDMTRASGTDLAVGIEAGRGALLRGGDDADQLYREAINRLGRTKMRVELARAGCSMANGCAGKAAGSRPAPICVSPTRR